jgi:hypothetical protein
MRGSTDVRNRFAVLLSLRLLVRTQDGCQLGRRQRESPGQKEPDECFPWVAPSARGSRMSAEFRQSCVDRMVRPLPRFAPVSSAGRILTDRHDLHPSSR